MPFWKLTGKLQELCIVRRYGEDITAWRIAASREQRREQIETDFTSFELPAELPKSPEAVNSIYDAITARTVITAARAGPLRRLTYVGWNGTQVPFNVRTLLPFWVHIEKWDISQKKLWHVAASSLVQFLAHASFWLESEAGRAQD